MATLLPFDHVSGPVMSIICFLLSLQDHIQRMPSASKQTSFCQDAVTSQYCFLLLLTFSSAFFFSKVQCTDSLGFKLLCISFTIECSVSGEIFFSLSDHHLALSAFSSIYLFIHYTYIYIYVYIYTHIYTCICIYIYIFYEACL